MKTLLRHIFLNSFYNKYQNKIEPRLYPRIVKFIIIKKPLSSFGLNHIIVLASLTAYIKYYNFDNSKEVKLNE